MLIPCSQLTEDHTVEIAIYLGSVPIMYSSLPLLQPVLKSTCRHSIYGTLKFAIL